MQITPRRHELLSIYLLGAGTLFLYLSYSCQTFIAESVIHTVSKRYPGTISEFAGYYGQALHYAGFGISTFFTPSVQNYMPSKWVLSIGSALFATYYLGFFRVNDVYYYSSLVLMGIGYSFYNNGEGAYISEHSSSRTLESNTSLETGIGHSCMAIGGAVLALIFYMLGQEKASSQETSLSFSDRQIHLIYGTLFMLNIISVVIYACLPTKQYDSIASCTLKSKSGFREQMVKFKKVLLDKHMLLLIPFFAQNGIIVSFLLGVYPTTLMFTSAFSGDYYVVAFYSMSMGVAELSGGILLKRLVKKCEGWGLIIIIACHFLAVSSAIVLVKLSVPELATIQPTTASPLLIKPSRIIVCVVGFLLGLSDFTVTSARVVICQMVIPNCRMQVFSLSRLYQCVFSCALLFVTPLLTITSWTAVLGMSLVIGATMFAVVARRTARCSGNATAPSCNESYVKY